MMHLATTLTAYALIYAILIVTILATRGAVCRFAGARWAYAMWFALLVPIVVALLPDALIATIRPEHWQHLSWPTTIDSSSSAMASLLVASAVAAWLFGVAFTATRAIWSMRRSSVALRKNRQTLSTTQQRLVARIAQQAGVFPCPDARFSAGIAGPAVLGVIHPALLLPLSFFERYSGPEQTLMIRHELAHLQRKDGWWNLLFCMLRCVFWFNPFVYLAERRFRLDQEQSCDQFVVWDEPAATRAAYATAMLKVTAPWPAGDLLAFRSTGPEILGRTALLIKHRNTAAQSTVGSLLLIIVLAVVLTGTVAMAAPPAQGPFANGIETTWCATYKSLGL